MGGLLTFLKRALVVAMTPFERFRPQSGAAQLVGGLGAVFFVIGLVLVLFGVDLDSVDRWIDRHGGALNAVGNALFRMVCFVLMLVGVLLAAMPVLHRTTERTSVPPAERAGVGTLLFGLLLAYFSWFGAFGD